jgi:GntR family transcriptional repressor for pyruvate dehydrogenase complex
MPTADLKRRTAASVADYLEGLILEGTLRPAARLLPERELSERLGVSRPTLRDGLQLLERKALLERMPSGALAVAQIGVALTDPLASLLQARGETTFDYLEFRGAVEGLAAGLAAERATDIDLDRIAACMARIDEAHLGTELGTDARVEAGADADLHLAIYEATHNLVLLHVMRAFSDMLRANTFYNREMLYAAPGVRDVLRAQHRAIYDAIRNRQAAVAREAAESHLRYTYQALRRIEAIAARREVAHRRSALPGLTAADVTDCG